MKRRERLDPQGSSEKGFYGYYEAALRRFKGWVHGATLVPLYGFAAICLGLALAPGLALVNFVLDVTVGLSPFLRYPAIGAAIATGYFMYGFASLVIMPLANRLLRAWPKPWRGPYHSLGAVSWYIHNALTYLVRYTFLEFITPTPYNLFFYRMMGMKIGKGVQINTTHISDPSLIELGDRVTIGGSAVLLAHYGVGGYLVIAPVKIGAGATIGLHAAVMGGVEIGENARILPNSVVLPKTHVPAGETWGGVPARKIDPHHDGGAEKAPALKKVEQPA